MAVVRCSGRWHSLTNFLRVGLPTQSAVLMAMAVGTVKPKLLRH
jgi:hypothetical protein